MSEHDDVREAAGAEEPTWAPVEGGLALDTPGEPSAETPAPERKRGLGSVLAALALVGGIAVVFGLAAEATAAWATARTPVSVPELAGTTPVAASKALAGAGLADGNASFVVTRSFPTGKIVGQSPAAGSEASRGTRINIRIATTPQPLTVPDFGLVPEAAAVGGASLQLLQPQVAYVWSKDVEVGRVIEQLPRPGDGAVSGSPLVLVVSQGPGTGGSTVPSLLGLTLAQARSVAASATLFPVARIVTAPGVADGTIVDQAPSPGSIVPVTSNVTLSVAIASSAP